MSNQIRTLLRHERSQAPTEKDRGARHWSAVQVMTSTWFFVESCEEGEAGIQRWVTTSIREATNIKRGLEPARWTRIFVCLRAPLSIREATLFEEIVEAYQIGSSGSYLYHLANGLSFVVGAETIQKVWTEPKELLLVYNQKSVQ